MMAEEQDPQKKTPTEMLMEMLQDPNIDKIKDMVIVYDDRDGFAVMGGHRDRFEVIGMLQYGIMTIYTTSTTKEL